MPGKWFYMILSAVSYTHSILAIHTGYIYTLKSVYNLPPKKRKDFFKTYFLLKLAKQKEGKLKQLQGRAPKSEAENSGRPPDFGDQLDLTRRHCC